jgi:hypothetical protein
MPKCISWFQFHVQNACTSFSIHLYNRILYLDFECEEKVIYLLCESQVCIKEGFDSANVFPVIPKQIRLLRLKNND